MHVAVDGWDLAVGKSSPNAWRTHELIELIGHAVDGWQWSLFGPATRPIELPANARSIGVSSPGGAWGQLLFEQLALPRAASRNEAEALLTLAGGLPLSSRVPLVMEARRDVPAGSGVADRLRRATRAAASLGATAFTWSDLAERVPSAGPAVRLSPWVADRFRPVAESGDAPTRTRLGLADGYVLGFGVGERDALRLLRTWSWVAPSVGEMYSLVVAGMHAEGDRAARRLADRLGLADTLRILDKLAYTDLPAVMRGAAVLLVPGGHVDGQLLRWALACGLPVAAASTPEAESILGDAAYITPAEDARALGAACLSVLVEEDLAESLRTAGARRAGSYHSGRGVEELAGLLRRAAHPR